MSIKDDVREYTLSSFRDDLLFILSHYAASKNSVAEMQKIRKRFRSILYKLQINPVVIDHPFIVVKYGAGQVNVANVPWIGLLDSRETKTLTKGVYVCYLFKADMTGLYLTLNQGVGKTETSSPTREHVEKLENFALQIRTELAGLSKDGFSLNHNIDLADTRTGKAYEKATIAYKHYGKDQLPSDVDLERDLKTILDAYDKYLQIHPPGTSFIKDPSSRIEDVDIPSFLKNSDLAKAKHEFHSLKSPEMKPVRLIMDYAENQWQLPNFQRYFDWKKDKVADLIESIFNDYYIGSFLLWEKAAGKEADLELINIDGVKKVISDPTSIILDGQQRITSLYWALRGPNIDSKPQKVSDAFFYINFRSFFEKAKDEIPATLKNDTIVSSETKYERKETFKKFLFPLYELDNYGNWVDEFEDYLLSRKDQINEEEIRSIRRTMEKRLRHMWDEFEVPCVFLPESMSLKQVADIFERLNTKGKLLGVFDLLMARLLKYGIPLRKYWTTTCERYPTTVKKYYGKSEKIPVYILQAVSLYYDKSNSCRREDILDIYNRIYKVNPTYSFEEHWFDCSSYVNQAIKSLEDPVSGFGAKGQGEVPFIPMIPVIAALKKKVASRPDKGKCFEKIDMWYWASVFSNAFSSSVDSTLSAHYKDLLMWFEDDNRIPNVIKDARKNIDNMDFLDVRVHGNAMYKGILSLLVLEHVRDFAERKPMGHAPEYHKHHIFPHGSGTTGSSDSDESILNVTWLTEETNTRIVKAKKPSTYMKQLLEKYYDNNLEELLDVLKSHFIDRTGYELMMKDADGFELFMKHRQDLIKKRIKQKLGIKKAEPKAVLIKPGDPWANRMAYEEAIASLGGTIQWLDKWFSEEGLKFLSRAVDPSKANKIEILTAIYSLPGKSASELFGELRASFRDFREHMKSKNVTADLRIMLSSQKSLHHDRFVFSNTRNYRLPSPDIVKRGQYSEISETQIKLPFNVWWDLSKDILNDWNAVRKMTETYDQTTKGTTT